MSSHGTYARVAPNGPIVVSGATTGLDMLEQALANWLMLELNREGGSHDRH